MKCTACGAGIEAGPLYRTGPKGPGSDPGWTCIACLKRAIVEALHRGADSTGLPGPFPDAEALREALREAAAIAANRRAGVAPAAPPQPTPADRRAAQDAARGIRAVPLPDMRRPWR